MPDSFLPLVACPECHRRFDAAGHAAGATFACSCGAAVTVPVAAAHDAPVVRCAACGAPREGGERACRYCASEFTLWSRDLDTLCPGCMARVSRKARFCHSCGTPILAVQATPPGSERLCPACPGRPALGSRRLGRAPVSILECTVCGGLWVDREIFEVMADRARLGQLPELGLAPEGQLAEGEGSTPAPGPAYRPCVVCGTLMNRKSQGGGSRVILDVCARHGIWFDLHELDRLLRFIREGGEERVKRRQEQEEREAQRQKRLAEGLLPWADPREQGWLGSTAGSRAANGVMLEGMVSFVGRIFERLFDR